MRSISTILISVIAISLLVSCNKQVTDNIPAGGLETKSLQVPDNFTWKTTQTVTVDLGISDGNPDGLLSRITLYLSEPASGAGPLASGSAGYHYNFVTPVIVPATAKGLWARIIYPGGMEDEQFIPIQNERVAFIFSPRDRPVNLKTLGNGPDCTTGCDQVLSGSGTVTIKDGQTFCVSSSFTGTVNFEPSKGGGTLRICGTAVLQNINNMGNDCQIVVAYGGKLTAGNLSINGSASVTAWQNTTVNISNLNLNQSGTQLVNYSDHFSIAGSFSPSGMVDNYGTMTITGDYNGNSPNGYLYNAGTLSVSGSVSMNHTLENSGSIYAGGNLNLNTNSEFLNTCKMTVQGQASLNAGTFTMNGGYLKVNSTFTVNGSGNLVLQNQSMVSALNITLNNGISGAGARNTIKTTGQVTINGNKTVSGPVEWADNDGQMSNGNTSQFINGATFVVTSQAINSIPTSTCNPEGFGTPAVSDTDGDGVPNSSDDYPNDPARAHNNYYPSATGYASLAYEDMWPSFGDFDMNDLVVNVRFNRVTNAQNQVVDLVNLYQIKAVGGTFRNGFGLQLDQVSHGAIKSVTGPVLSPGTYINVATSGLEAGTEKPVVILWDDAESLLNRAGGTYFNTDEGAPAGTSVPVTLTLRFTVPQPATSIGLPPYNHFLIRNGVREHEVHLPGYMPTSKADTDLFGTGDDATNPATGYYYRSGGNLPWGLFVAGEFDYPVERTDISSAHLNFGTWAQSSGTLYPDWYHNLPGYRNSGKIYGD